MVERNERESDGRTDGLRLRKTRVDLISKQDNSDGKGRSVALPSSSPLLDPPPPRSQSPALLPPCVTTFWSL